MFGQALRSLRRTTIRTLVRGGVVVGTLEVTTHLPSEGRSSELYHYVADEIVTPAMRKTCTPEHAHDLAIQLLQASKEESSSSFIPPCWAPTFRPSAKEQRIDVTTKLFSTATPIFSNPIGMAAGFDKDGVAIQALMDLGFGFVEIGSVTLHPQPGNPSPRMFRLIEDEAIINRYGFNSVGADAVEENLKEFRRRQQSSSSSSSSSKGVLGVNLGLNKTSTTPVEDYQALIRQLGPYADYLVINVSSPNTPGLRDLQFSLERLLTACLEARNSIVEDNKSATLPPLLVKLSPDLTDQQLLNISQVLQKVGIDGIIVTNTTTERPVTLQSPEDDVHETGGLSGKPLRERSTECIRNLYEWTNGTIPIIGVGGIFTAHDAYEKIRAGASVVQVYSGMVYQGPGTVSKLRDGLAGILLENGYRRLEDVVGIDHEDLYWKKRVKAMESAQKQEKVFVAMGGEEKGLKVSSNGSSTKDGEEEYSGTTANVVVT